MEWKLLTAGVALCAVAGVGLFGEHLEAQAAEEVARQEQREESLGRVLPRSPSAVLRNLHNWIAGRAEPEKACLELDQRVRPQFARAFGERDCGAAMRLLSTQVTDANTYVEFHFRSSVDQQIHGDTGYMDGCAITWGGGLFDPPAVADPGPRLGKLTMRRVAGQGFLVTGFEPCPSTTTAEPPTTGPSTTTTAPNTAGSAPPAGPAPTTTRPWLLPTYAPGVPALLAAHIARSDPDTCGLFTTGGAAAFAAAHGAADCAAAVAKLRGQVTDPQKYAHPDLGGPKATLGANGTTVVNGCALTWSVFGQGQVQPGPPIGRLTLQHPPDSSVSYQIVGYTPC